MAEEETEMIWEGVVISGDRERGKERGIMKEWGKTRINCERGERDYMRERGGGE